MSDNLPLRIIRQMGKTGADAETLASGIACIAGIAAPAVMDELRAMAAEGAVVVRMDRGRVIIYALGNEPV